MPAVNPDFQVLLERCAHDVLMWVGFGTLTGLLAKAIMPGRDPGGPIATVLMGIGGCVIGCGTLMFFYEGQRVTPISPVGFLVATGGAFIILFFYRLLSGRLLREHSPRASRLVLPAPHRRRELVLRHDEEE
ncbi:MAG: GlsB/YeaQ/YmgE family stress response membrane protein [Pirellulales bacterium]|nr:GlsB/YeaQ/YmgE family stress response membrane protein [Pirellulales bacterium]